MNTKRLFLFAGYSADGIVDDALVYYVKTLNNFGDVILFLDCNCKSSELSKLKPYCKYVNATRHGEYDFGSYKRGFQYARDNNLLGKYDYVYIVNDSVFGPLFDMSDIISKMDTMESDACGIVISKHKTHSFMESWFVRLNKKIVLSDWFDEFISGVTTQPTKNRVTVKYEHGLSKIISEHNLSWDGVYICHGRYTYNNPKKLFKLGCPFIKRACFTRHNGALGYDIKYILKKSDHVAATKIKNTANRIYGKNYMNWFLTSNPIKILARKIGYAIKKIKNGKI
jgi:lipopolysaccharide biosynthesis protein